MKGAVERIELEVDIAGHQFKQTYPAQPNQSAIFTWDGYDIYGRFLQGGQPVSIKAGNVYDTRMYTYIDSFGLPPEREFDHEPNSPGGNGLGELELAARSLGRSSLRAWRMWTVSVHHAYDVGAGRLLFGDGSVRTQADMTPIIQRITGWRHALKR